MDPGSRSMPVRASAGPVRGRGRFDAKEILDAPTHRVGEARTTTRPGLAPVCSPSRNTSTPFTKTELTPVAY